MWKGKVTEELRELFREYADKFVSEPDGYDEICCNAMTYDEFVGYIRECLRRGEEMPEVVE